MKQYIYFYYVEFTTGDRFSGVTGVNYKIQLDTYERFKLELQRGINAKNGTSFVIDNFQAINFLHEEDI